MAPCVLAWPCLIHPHAPRSFLSRCLSPDLLLPPATHVPQESLPSHCPAFHLALPSLTPTLPLPQPCHPDQHPHLKLSAYSVMSVPKLISKIQVLPQLPDFFQGYLHSLVSDQSIAYVSPSLIFIPLLLGPPESAFAMSTPSSHSRHHQPSSGPHTSRWLLPPADLASSAPDSSAPELLRAYFRACECGASLSWTGLCSFP